ncbi:F-box/kelch-repeat protein At3g23880-like [Corylus avellana]|uniref:F-box/kelch-repeat protein At3g23880-like n=1 Tax=Corylus avellana TaxID=13451 RepID=UPI00286BE325|nr:F-box/kelch-repeat protein At3g23880-like [Corylus avellana]
MSEYLPDEGVTDILQRLPVKSLLRFRCVSKSWNSLITSPAFIDSHLNQSIPNNTPPHPLLIVRSCVSYPNSKLNKEHYKLFPDNEAFEQCAEVDFPVKSRRRHHFTLIGYVNGLMCLFEHDRFILWNPSIRKVLNLPKPCITLKTHGRTTCHEAFGFDPRTNDYKVVRIAIPWRTTAIVKETLVEVYSVSTGSWRISSTTFPPLTTVFDTRLPKPCVEGSVHFTARNRSYTNIILSFDLRDEVFREMIFPYNIGYRTYIATCRVSGSLTLLSYHTERSWSVWVMKEYGAVDSWVQVQQTTIDIAEEIENVLGFKKNGHVLLQTRKKHGHCDLLSYDPESQQTTKLEIPKEMHTFFVDTYRENLVLLNQEANDVVSRSRVTKKRKNSIINPVRELGCVLDEMKRKCEDAAEEAKRKLFRAEQLQEKVQRMVFRQNQLMEKVELVARQLQMEVDCPQIQLEEEMGSEVRELQEKMRAIKQELQELQQETKQ